MKKIKSSTLLAIFCMILACAKNKEKDVGDALISGEQTIEKNHFSGTYVGQLNGINYSIILVKKNKIITGILNVSGKLANVQGTSSGNNCSGTLIDQETTITYPFTGQLISNVLKLQLNLKPLGGEMLLMDFTKENSNSEATAATKTKLGNLNSNLFGLWRHTSVYSSGTGDMHFSMQTDYFLELKPNGQFVRWSGDSSASTQEVNTYTNEEDDKTAGTWYCEGKFLCTKLEAPNSKVYQVQYYQENNQMMFTINNEKTVYDRIR